MNLAVALAAAGRRVGLLDADIWGFSIPRMLGVTGRRLEAGPDRKIAPLEAAGLQLVSTGLLLDDEDRALMWRGLMLSKALEQFLRDVAWDPGLDYLILDLPPGTGDVQMALARLLPQAELVVVTTPQKAAQKVAARVADMARRSYLPVLGVIENMSGFTTEDGAPLRPVRRGRRTGTGRRAGDSPPGPGAPRPVRGGRRRLPAGPWSPPIPRRPPPGPSSPPPHGSRSCSRRPRRRRAARASPSWWSSWRPARPVGLTGRPRRYRQSLTISW